MKWLLMVVLVVVVGCVVER